MKKSSKSLDKDAPKLLAEISHKLDLVIAAVASSNKDRAFQVNRLLGVKLKPKEIAEVLGTTPGAMRVFMSEAKKSKRGRQP